MEAELDYGDELVSIDDEIDMRAITFKMPDRFIDSKHYLNMIWEMMELEHRDIKRQRMYRVFQQIIREDFTSTFQ